ncbi:MAG TPA: rhodanese-like domain-containing protein [Rhizomicrobium sp.]|jgi:thiosulfate/3-mercaptopyruvate sulfurtransferase|nr:rhodanese-like domain-containing protein [Rhizomicrobium sp.]
MPHTATLIIGAQDVPAFLHDRDPIILAVQSKLAHGQAGYLAGALLLDEDAWTTASRHQAQLDDLHAWGARIGALGIDGKRPVLVYDDGELKFASRVRYLLGHFGVKEALLVNGGWQALAALKLKFQSGPSAPVPASFAAHIVEPPIPTAPRARVQRDYRSHNVTLIDVRTPAEYDGTDAFPGITRPGHIPGAVNLPIAELFEKTHANDLLDPARLADVFAAHRIDRKKTIIFYCQDGARSSLGALAAKEADYPHVELYYLSFLDWQSDPKDPVDK